jgi:hypothetical protein
MCTKSGDDVGKILGCHSQVEQPVATRAELFIQFRKVVLEPFETVIVVKIRLEILHAIKKGIKPRIGFRDAPSLEDSVLHVGNKCLGEIPARHSYDCEFFRKQTRLSQMKKRRKQLPLRQVSGRSENHEDAGFGNAFVLPAMLDRPQRRRDCHIDLPCFLAKSTGRQQLPARKPSRVAGSHEDGDWIDIHDLAGLTEPWPARQATNLDCSALIAPSLDLERC